MNSKQKNMKKLLKNLWPSGIDIAYIASLVLLVSTLMMLLGFTIMAIYEHLQYSIK